MCQFKCEIQYYEEEGHSQKIRLQYKQNIYDIQLNLNEINYNLKEFEYIIKQKLNISNQIKILKNSKILCSDEDLKLIKQNDIITIIEIKQYEYQKEKDTPAQNYELSPQPFNIQFQNNDNISQIDYNALTDDQIQQSFDFNKYIQIQNNTKDSFPLDYLSYRRLCNSKSLLYNQKIFKNDKQHISVKEQLLQKVSQSKVKQRQILNQLYQLGYNYSETLLVPIIEFCDNNLIKTINYLQLLELQL